MAQDRKPCSYQEYPADMLAQLPFRIMPLAARGLLYTMRLECWINARLPKNPDELAKILGQPVAEVAASLPAVMAFFSIDGGFIFSPELENYREHLSERRRRQSEGGKRSSEARNGKRKSSTRPVDKGAASTLPSNLQVPTQGSVKSVVEQSRAKQSQEQSLERDFPDDDFVSSYSTAEAEANAYRLASGK